MKIPLPLAVIGLAACLLACGQKGPLVLPSAQRPHKKIAVPKAPAATPRPAITPAAPSAPAGATPAPPSTNLPQAPTP